MLEGKRVAIVSQFHDATSVPLGCVRALFSDYLLPFPIVALI